MKTFVKILPAAALALLSAFGCNPDTPTGGDGMPANSVALSGTTFEVASKSVQPFTIDVTADGEWNVVNSLSWVSVEPASGTGNATITVTVSDNYVGEVEQTPRSGQIAVGSVIKSVKVTISQKGNNNVSLPYSIDFTQGQDAWVIEDVKIDSLIPSPVWVQSATYGMKAQAYLDYTNFETDTYLISPVFDLTSETTAIASFKHARKYGDLSQLSVVVREAGDTPGAWAAVTVSNWPDGTSWDFINSGDIDLSSYAGKKIQVAYRYTSTTSGCPTWEIKTFEMTNVSVPTFPAVTDSINVSASATSASFTVLGNVDWTVTCAPETMTAAPDSGKGEKKVTLSFPANESTTDTVKYTVTVATTAEGITDKSYSFVVCQAPKSAVSNTVSEVYAADEGAAFSFTGLRVLSAGAKWYVAADATGVMLVYPNAVHGAVRGDVVSLEGTKALYNSGFQIGAGSVTTKTGTTTDLSCGTPYEPTAAEMDAWVDSASTRLVKYTATVDASSTYYARMEGQTKKIDNYCPSDITLETGKTYEFVGLLNGSKPASSYTFVYIISAEEPKSDKNLDVDATSHNVGADSTSVQFTVNANVSWTASCPAQGVTVTPASGSDTTLVTVTFPANASDSTVNYTVTVSTEEAVPVKTRTVTIAQAGNVSKTVSDIYKDAVGTNYSLTGLRVIAVGSKWYLVADATGVALVYPAATHSFALGDVVTLSGVSETYNGGYQFGKTAVVTKTGTTSDLSYGTPYEPTAAEMDAWVATASTKVVKYTATVDASSTYYAQMEGQTKKIDNYCPSNITLEKGKKYSFVGLLNGSKAASNYTYVYIISASEIVPSKAFSLDKTSVSVGAADSTATFTVKAKGVSWTAACPTQGVTVTPASGSDTTLVTVSFPANSEESNKTYTVTVTPADSEFQPATFTVTQGGAGAAVYTSNVTWTINNDTKSYADTVKIDGTKYPAVKVGTSNKVGTFTFVIPAGTTELSFYAAGWNGKGDAEYKMSIGETEIISSSASANTGPYSVVGPYVKQTVSINSSLVSSEATVTVESTKTTSARIVFWGINAK